MDIIQPNTNLLRDLIKCYAIILFDLGRYYYKSQPANKNNWQFMTLAYMTVVMALDLFFLITYLESLLGYYFYAIKIPIIPQKIGDPISFIILFAGPPLLLNYMLIFRNQRYKKLIKKYKYHEGKLGVTFLLLALFIPLIALWLGLVG